MDEHPESAVIRHISRLTECLQEIGPCFNDLPEPYWTIAKRTGEAVKYIRENTVTVPELVEFVSGSELAELGWSGLRAMRAADESRLFPWLPAPADGPGEGSELVGRGGGGRGGGCGGGCGGESGDRAPDGAVETPADSSGGIRTTPENCAPDPCPSEPGGAGYLDPGRGSAVVLRGLTESPLVFGVEKPVLSPERYRVVEALLDAGAEGLRGSALERLSNCGDARKTLKRLADSDPDWAAVIYFPGKLRNGYRILLDVDPPELQKSR